MFIYIFIYLRNELKKQIQEAQKPLQGATTNSGEIRGFQMAVSEVM